MVVYLAAADNVSMQAIAGIPPHEIGCVRPSPVVYLQHAANSRHLKTGSNTLISPPLRGGFAMVSPLFFYQLILVALVWLCLMLQWAWPSDPTAVCPTAPEPTPPANSANTWFTSMHH